jgi:RNA-directed DNA polymerase
LTHSVSGGFQYRSEAERFLAELRERFLRFGLELHADKTRLIEFGRFATENRGRRGEGKPHVCDKTRNGKFIVLRQTVRKRMRAKLKRLKEEPRVRWHVPIPAVGEWLRSVLLGHYQYYGVPRTSLPFLWR